MSDKMVLFFLLLQLIYCSSENENNLPNDNVSCRPLYRPIRRFKAIALNRQLKEIKNNEESVPRDFTFDLIFVQHDSFHDALAKHDAIKECMGGILFYSATEDVISYYLAFAKPGELLCYTKKNKTREWASLNEVTDYNLKVEILESTYSGNKELHQFEYQDICVPKDVNLTQKTSKMLLGCSLPSRYSQQFDLPPPMFEGVYFQIIDEKPSAIKGIEFLTNNLPFPEELSGIIERKPFQLFSVPNDGACLYHSLAKSYNDLHFNKKEITKDDVLTAIVDQLLEWKQNRPQTPFTYKRFGNLAARDEVDFFENYEDALKRNPREFYDYKDSENWGDEELIPVFGALYETNVFVFQAGTPTKFFILTQAAFVIDINYPWVFIFNAFGQHFDALLVNSNERFNKFEF